MCNKKPNELPSADQYMPSSQESELGCCLYCPEYTFLSKTEKKRHLQVFHPKRRTPSLGKVPKPRGKFTCSNQLIQTQKCDATFPNMYMYLLRKHRKEAKHQRKSKIQKASVHYGVDQYVSRVMTAITADEAGSTNASFETDTESDDEEAERWIECSKCMYWIHKSCLPLHYSHAETDEIFLCPECAIKKPRLNC